MKITVCFIPKILTLIVFLVLAENLSALEVPSLTGPVVDNAGIFNSNELTELSSSIRNYYSKTGVQFQILTVRSLEGESVEVYAIRVAEVWQIGGKNGSGIIIIAALDDKKIRIEDGAKEQLTEKEEFLIKHGYTI